MSHYKENMGNNPSQTVKLEPTEVRMPALTTSNGVKVKGEVVDTDTTLFATASKPGPSSTVAEHPEDEDVQMEDAADPVPPPTSTPLNASDFKVYTTAEEIEYTSEYALQQGLKMVNKLASTIEALQLGPRRQEVWLRDTTSLRSQGVPSTLIAVCGATGAGKSSLLNAILDDNIVPTSGMRACTAVVTEIAYHKKKTIDADVSFLSETEWKEELEILLGDLVEEDGTIKRSADLKSDAGVAWQKVHAVYPTISQERLVTMTADQIIAKDPKIARILGATKKIVARDSKTFTAEIAKYIDSKEKKRSKDKKKDKKKKNDDEDDEQGDKDKKKDNDKKKDKKSKDDGPALWPLIRGVNVRCSAPALATGAILVDLPGTGDANAARNSIAKTYLKKANCVWVLAPIQRAVDDKIAKDLLGDAFRIQLMMDGGYDDKMITFIATKCDDISCSEAIRALGLDDDEELEVIEEKINRIRDNTSEWKKKKGAADRLVKSVEKDLKEKRAIHAEHKEHLECFQDGKPFVARLTAKKSGTPKPKATKSKKRKNTRGGKKGSPKRQRSESVDGDEDEDDEMSSDSDKDSDDSGSDSDSDSRGSDSDDLFADDSDKASDDGEDSDREKDSDIESVHEEEQEEEEVTEEAIKADIAEAKKTMDETRQRLNDARKAKKDAIDHLATLKKKAATAQKEKNGFCSKKRSEYSRGHLKEDFRSGLKDLDEAVAEERDPANFDPSIPIRDYDAIDLPVFTASSRDYARLKGLVRGDGEPSCFSNPRDTGIPDIQEWCHSLTKSSRERSAKRFLKELARFAKDVKDYVTGIGDVTAVDRETLRDKWESGEQETEPADDDDPFSAILGNLANNGLYTMPTYQPKVDRYGHPIGITPRLMTEFGQVVENSVSSLKDHLRDGLEERCRVGALNAAESAVPTSDEFAGSMHWASYRATLRRNGEYRRDLNVELVNPFTRNIATKWQQVFEADIFSGLLSSTVDCINKLIGDIERSAASGLKDRARIQGESCLESARVALDKTIETVKETLSGEQKEISRSLAPHVQEQLLDGYETAMEERGAGSVARQKAVFHSFIKDRKDEIFEDSADVIMDRLTGAADAIGKTLTVSLDDLAQKIEVNLAVLWEGVRDDPGQVQARTKTVTQVNEVLDQLRLFGAAEMARHEDTAMD